MNHTALVRRLEKASLRAWPALEVEEYDGWRLRFSEGFTKRANSVQPLGVSQLPLREKVLECEAWYRSRGSPCIFRITPLSEPALEGLLAEEGYVEVDRTSVLQREIGGEGPASTPDRSRAVALSEWLETFARLSEMPAGPPPALRRILEQGIERRRLALLWSEEQGGPVACGMGAREGGPTAPEEGMAALEEGMAAPEGGLVGLFDLVTAPRHRRSGFGTELVRSLLAWAERHGANRAYLQVTHRNVEARRLYEKLRFEHVYDYVYRVRTG